MLQSNCINGFFFLISCLYYKSSWKYERRGMRDWFLDSKYYLDWIRVLKRTLTQTRQLVFDFYEPTIYSKRNIEYNEFVMASLRCLTHSKAISTLAIKKYEVSGTDDFEMNVLMVNGSQNQDYQLYSNAILDSVSGRASIIYSDACCGSRYTTYLTIW